MAVYVDTGAWIALYEPKDRNHPAAKAALRHLLAEGEPLVTGWHTVVEFSDGLVHHYDQARAAGELARMLASPRLTVLPSEPVRQIATEMFRSRTDWNVDLSDCLSFALMDEEGVSQAFAFDTDFEKAGFSLIPEK